MYTCITHLARRFSIVLSQRTTMRFTGYPAGDRHCIQKYNIYLQLEIDIQIVSKNLILQTYFCSKFLVAQIVQLWIFIKFTCLFQTRDRYLNYFLNICILKKPKAIGIYPARDISPARHIYLQLEIYISSQIYIYIYIYIYLELYRHIYLDREKQLDCIQKFDFVYIIFVLNFQWLTLSNWRYSTSSYVFFKQEIDI